MSVCREGSEDRCYARDLTKEWLDQFDGDECTMAILRMSRECAPLGGDDCAPMVAAEVRRTWTVRHASWFASVR